MLLLHKDGKQKPSVVAIEILIVTTIAVTNTKKPSYSYRASLSKRYHVALIILPLRASGWRSARTKNPFYCTGQLHAYEFTNASICSRQYTADYRATIIYSLSLFLSAPFFYSPLCVSRKGDGFTKLSSSANETATCKKGVLRLETLVVTGCPTVRHVLFFF